MYICTLYLWQKGSGKIKMVNIFNYFAMRPHYKVYWIEAMIYEKITTCRIRDNCYSADHGI